MEKTGIIKEIDSLGRLHIPKEIRKILMTLDCEACDYKDALKKYYYDQVNS